jgi:hypothetical protein
VNILYRTINEPAFAFPIAKEAIMKTVELMLVRPPKTKWSLMLLATLCPDHEVFKKNYRPPVPEPQEDE